MPDHIRNQDGETYKLNVVIAQQAMAISDLTAMQLQGQSDLRLRDAEIAELQQKLATTPPKVDATEEQTAAHELAVEACKTELEACKTELETCKAELEDAQTASLVASQKAQDAHEQKVTDLKKQLTDLKEELKKSRDAHENAQNAVADLKTVVTTLEEQLAGRQVKLDTVNKELAFKKKELEDAQANHVACQNARNALEKDVKYRVWRRFFCNITCKCLQKQLDTSEQKLVYKEEELKAAQDKLANQIADLKTQPTVAQATQTTNVAASPPAPPAEADRKKVMVKVTPPLEQSDVDQINQILAGVQDGKNFFEKYMVTADFSRLTYAIITQKEGGDTENLQKALESLMRLLNDGNYTCTPSSLMSAKPKNLANMMQTTGMDAQQWEKQLQQEMDNKKAQTDKKKAEKTQEPLDKAHLDECCTRAKWHYHKSHDGIVFNVDAESIIGKCGFDSSLEVDEHLAGPFAGTRGRNLMEEIAWPNNVYCHLMDGHTKGRKKRLLVYGTDINRNEAMAAAKALLKRVTAAAADTHASNTVGDHAAHAMRLP